MNKLPASEAHLFGKFWEIDANGFIVNDASQSKISHRYQDPIEMATEVYRIHLGDTLQGVYVRGTVPRGTAIPGISDLDTFAVAIAGETTDSLPWAGAAQKKIILECPDLTGVGFECWLISDVMDSGGVPELSFALKTQSVCVFGDDLSDQLSPYRPDAMVARIDLSRIKDDIDEANVTLLSDTITEGQVRYWCRRIMKNIIRAGFCLTMESERKFTRDLTPCVQIFANHYPQKKEKMQQALHYAIDPIINVADLETFLNEFGGWITDETDAWFERHDG